MTTWQIIKDWFSLFFSEDNLRDLFLYSEETPLIFTRFFFWGFFAVVIFFFSIVHKRIWLRNAFLFLVSLFFYYKTSGLFISILIFSTISDYFIGLGLGRAHRQIPRLILVTLSVVINLFVLAYFKYALFFTESYNQLFTTQYELFNHFAYWANINAGTSYDVNSILLPVGISFFTFQTISYSVDVYRKRIEPVKSFLDFGFYVSFFPQLVAGPIVRANEFIPQLYKPYSLDKKMFGLALFMILNGLLKKLIIGDYIAVNFIDRVFDNPLYFTGFENLMALVGYSLQVYADFSGYTDIAIGVAMLMGFILPENFNSPYKAKNVGEFWKRWHISLSTWLKDYLYIPLGGNRNASAFSWVLTAFILIIVIILVDNWLIGILISVLAILGVAMLLWVPGVRNHVTTNINLMLTMLLGGLWHGASSQFIIWGALNGVGLVVYKFWRKISPWENKTGWVINSWKIFLTFSFITFTRLWFRSETAETPGLMMSQMGGNFRGDLIPSIIASYPLVFSLMLAGFIIHWLPVKVKQGYRDLFVRMPLPVQALASIIAVIIAFQAVSAGLQPFIYFQF